MTSSAVKIIDTPRGQFALKDSEGEGFPLIMLHGWPESSHCWEAVVKLMKPGFRLIRPDLRGTGDSERSLDEPNLYAKNALAQDIWAIADYLQLKRCGIIGHDWGGIVAQEMTLARPEQTVGLVLMNISLINNAKAALKAREKLKEGGMRYLWYQSFLQSPGLAEAMIPGNEEVWLHTFLRFADKKPFPEESLQEYVRTLKIPHSAQTNAYFYRSMAEDLPRWQQLAAAGTKFNTKGLYLYGNRDSVIIPEYLAHLEESFENGQIEQYETRAGHFIQEEAPEFVAGHLNRFFEKLV